MVKTCGCGPQEEGSIPSPRPSKYGRLKGIWNTSMTQNHWIAGSIPAAPTKNKEGRTLACQMLLKSIAGNTVAGSTPAPSFNRKFYLGSLIGKAADSKSVEFTLIQGSNPCRGATLILKNVLTFDYYFDIMFYK